MANLTEQRRKAANALPVIAPAAPEVEHSETCTACGQRIDLRNLDDVLRHERAEHERVESD